jgi:hypothetical protein
MIGGDVRCTLGLISLVTKAQRGTDSLIVVSERSYWLFQNAPCPDASCGALYTERVTNLEMTL